MTRMNELEKRFTDSWNKTILDKFGVNIGLSLDELNKEYDEMIKAFELQVSTKSIVYNKGIWWMFT